MLILNWILKLSKLKFDRNISVTIIAIIKSVGWWGLCINNEFKCIHCRFRNLHNVTFSPQKISMAEDFAIYLLLKRVNTIVPLLATAWTHYFLTVRQLRTKGIQTVTRPEEISSPGGRRSDIPEDSTSHENQQHQESFGVWEVGSVPMPWIQRAGQTPTCQDTA